MTPQPSPDLSIGLEVTRRCNLHCPHCYTASHDQREEGAPLEVLQEWLSQVAALGVRAVGLCGGEPLLRGDLELLMQHGLQAGLRHYSMVSNGLLVTAARARSLRIAGLRTAQVSLDGVTAEDYDQVRNSGPAAYYRAIRGIRHLQDEGIDVMVACLLSPHNLERVPEMMLLCEALKVSSLRYCTFVPSGRGGSDLFRTRYALPKEALRRYSDFMTAANARPDIPVRVMVDHPAGPCGENQHVECSAGSLAYIASDGEVYPCTSLIAPEFSLGNLHQVPLQAALESPQRFAVTRIPKHELSGPCRVCENEACSGGCRGAAYFSTGDVKGAVLNCIHGPLRSQEPAPVQ